MMRSLVFFSFLICSVAGFTQSLINGTVVDQTTGEPIPGTLVTSNADSTITDGEGHFRINPGNPPTIEVRVLGYEHKTINNPAANLTIRVDPSVISLNEVTINSGTKNEKIKNTAGSVSVVSKGMIQRDAPFSITNAINRVPGVYMHSGTYNTNRITIRGIGSRNLFGTNKIKAYYDEIPLTDGSGNSTIEDIDQGLIDRVEVLKGPNSSTYGAGLAGVIRLHSFRPDPDASSVESGITLGSYKTFRWQNRLAHSDEKQSLSAAFSKTQTGGYRENSQYNRNQVGITGEWKLGAKNKISLISTYTDLKGYIPSALDEDDYQNAPEKAAFTWAAAEGFESYDKFLGGVSFTRDFSKSWKLTSAVFYQFRDAYEPRPFDILQEKTASIGTRNVISGQFGEIGLSSGVELFKDTYEWGTFENTAPMDRSAKGSPLSDYTEDRRYYNLFAEAAFNLNTSLKLVGGVNLNGTFYDLDDQFNEGDANQSGTYQFDPVLSPRIGAVYHIHPFHHLFANVSHGFSPPSLDETLRPDGQINPDIRPEKGWNYEVGIRGNHKGLSYDFVGYYMQIEDLLVAQRTDNDQYYGVNAGLNNHFGTDLFLNYLIDVSENYQVNIFNSTSYMHYRFARFVNEGINYDGNQLTGVPELIVNSGVELLSKKGVYGNINGQYVGKVPITDANSLYADQYFVLRAKVGYLLNFDPLTISLNAGIDNLLNEKYASMLLINNTGFGGASPRYYYPGTPRNYFAGIHLKYNL